MSVRKILNLLCLILTALCLSLGYARIGLGMALAAGLVIPVVWLLAYRWPASWFPSIALVVTIGLAVIELLQGAPALLMLAAAVLALVNWDLALLARQPRDSLSIQKFTLLEKNHYQSLLVALGLAFPVMFIGRLVHFHIPFGLMVLLVLLAFFSLMRVWTQFSESSL